MFGVFDFHSVSFSFPMIVVQRQAFYKFQLMPCLFVYLSYQASVNLVFFPTANRQYINVYPVQLKGQFNM